MSTFGRLGIVLVGAVIAACAQATTVDTTEGGGGAGTGAQGHGAGSTTSQGGHGGVPGDGGGGHGGNSPSSGGGGSGGTSGTAGAGGEGGSLPTCGDGLVNIGEDCDGPTSFPCADLGFSGGNVTCTPDCTFNLAACDGCGDGFIQQMLGEECDFDAMGDPLVAATCQSLGFPDSIANPGCQPDCKFDIRPCQCGNDMIDDMEPCDGADLNGHTCQTEGFGSGVIVCTSTCELDTSACTLCGNNAVDLGEMCDNANLAGHTCQTQGFVSGTLSCAPNCQFDTSLCTKCGNGIIDPGETCDGANFGGQTCQTQGFGAGALACTPTCQISTAGCGLCGNNMLNMGESCDDGNNVSGDGCSATCQLEVMACDPDGTYTLTSGAVAYTCCFGLVSINVSSFVFSNNGAIIASSPSNPVNMTGAATTCPVGSFNNTGTIPGGCAETYHLTGSYTSANTWTGTYEVQFSGPDCSCFGGVGTPCVNQLFSVTATR